MKILNTIRLTAAALGLAIAGTVGAAEEQQQRFSSERSQPATCADVNWNEEMAQNHPGLIDACREVVMADGRSWARFEARFLRVEPDGKVVFDVRDRNDRSREEVVLTPAQGQVAYIDGRETPFRQLRRTDSLNLYVPEGEYGFATQPGGSSEELATVATVADARDHEMDPVTRQQEVAQRDPLPDVLPQTATSLPWLAFAGFIALFGGLSLSALRRRVTGSA
jgi:LPXTG-motif cell wall-anchored protein